MRGRARLERPFIVRDLVRPRDRAHPAPLIFRVCKVYRDRGELELAAVDPAVRLTANKSGAFRAMASLFVHAR